MYPESEPFFFLTNSLANTKALPSLTGIAGMISWLASCFQACLSKVYSLFFRPFRAIPSKCKSDHVSPLLRTLQWLSPHSNSKARIFTVDYKAQQDLAFYFVSDLLTFPHSCPPFLLLDFLPLLQPCHPPQPLLAPRIELLLPDSCPGRSLPSFRVFHLGFPNHPNYHSKKPLSKYLFFHTHTHRPPHPSQFPKINF